MANSNADGMNTTRLSGTPSAVAERLDDAAWARRALIRRNARDLLEVLGLDGDGPSRRCPAPGCGKLFVPTTASGKQRCCTRSCASILAAAERRADASERQARVKSNV